MSSCISSKGQVTSAGFLSHNWCESDLSTIHYWLHGDMQHIIPKNSACVCVWVEKPFEKNLCSSHGISCFAVFCFTANSVREVTSLALSKLHFLWFLHLASSPSDSIQAGSSLLFTVINPRFETDTCPITLHLLHFSDFYQNDHNWNETFFPYILFSIQLRHQVFSSVFQSIWQHFILSLHPLSFHPSPHSIL